MSAVAFVRELLYFPRAFAESKRLPDEVRRAVEQALRLGRQKHRAARALWFGEQRAEGLGLAVDALHAGLSGATAYGPLLPPGDPLGHDPRDVWQATDAVMRGLGASRRALSALERARHAVQSLTLPADDDSVPEVFDDIVAGWCAVDRVLARASVTPAELRYRRLRRVMVGVLIVLFAALAGWKVSRMSWGLTASASGFYANNPEYAPEQVLDGSPATEWLLPDGATGWLEVRSNKPRKIREIRILNGHNPGHEDRAVKSYRVEIFSRDRLLLTVDGNIAFSSTPTWVTHPIGVNQADRVRITVLGVHWRGGGLAEVEVR